MVEGEMVIESILRSIKQLLGIDSDFEQFDSEIIIHINSAIGDLTNLGVGIEEGYFITGYDEVWEVFLDREPQSIINSAKLFVYFRVRLSFDPPMNSFLVDSMDRQIKELSWKMVK